jgi:hypothetical protein
MWSAEPMGRALRLPRNIDLDPSLDGSFGAFTSGKPMRVRLQFKSVTACLVSERQWHQSHKITPIAGREDKIELTMTGPDSPEVLG